MTETQAEYSVDTPDIGRSEEYNFHDLVGYNGMSLFLKRKLTWDEARYAGNVLVFMYQQVQFALGDFMRACTEIFGDKAYQLPIFSYSVSRLKTMKQIAERISPDNRREDMAFGYHEEVAYIPVELQAEWLAKAKKYNWSTRDLREALIGAGLKEPRKRRDPKIYHIPCPHCGAEFELSEEELL